MLKITRFDSNGKYVCKTHCHEDALQFEETAFVYLGHVDMETQYHDLGANRPVKMPPKPFEFYDFDYTRKQWVANPEAAWASVKQQRARLLSGSDWMVTKAAESGQTVLPEWIAYRQALRDITLQVDPWAIVWPVAP